MEKNLYLVGMMGAGKTTVSKILADNLGFSFIDMDTMIVEREKMSINDIFERFGESYFRHVESKVLSDIARDKRKVVSTGGGVVLNELNIDIMKESGVIFYLKTSADTLAERLRGADDRPLLKDVELDERLAKLLEARSDLYEKADFTVVTDDKSPEEVALDIVKLLKIS